jgi:four helix bundle suffix protein
MVAANILICLMHQTNYLLDHLIRKLEKSFVEEGGLRERMTQARLAERAKQKSQLTDVVGSGDRHSFKSSSRYYCTDIVHSSRAKEKFR